VREELTHKNGICRPSASHDGPPRLNFVNKLPKTIVARGEESEFDIEARGLEIEIDELD
jgi:hypothetical protein